jgi:glycerol-3-phosphate acyltransferase PlsY
MGVLLIVLIVLLIGAQNYHAYPVNSFFDFTGGKAVAEPPENKIKELSRLPC